MRARLGLASLWIAVAGCSSGAQISPLKSMQAAAWETRQATDACYRGIWSKPEYANIASMLYLGTDYKVPLQYMTNTASPTKKDIALLYKLHADNQTCSKVTLDGYAKVHPSLMLVQVQAYSARDKLWADAVSGRLTWGQFNTSLKDIAVKTETEWTQATSQIEAQSLRQEQFESEQRQRAIAAFQQWSYQQQALANQREAIAAANRPPPIKTINCNYVGSTAQCTSY
jgi:hypothetical protein